VSGRVDADVAQAVRWRGRRTPAWTARIAAAWRKSVERILEAGRPLIDAKRILPCGAFVAHGDDLIGFVAHDHLRLGIIAECADRAAACAQRAANVARRHAALAVMLRQMRMFGVAIDACEELGEREGCSSGAEAGFGSTGKEGKNDQ
jgi:hypothetical protein